MPADGLVVRYEKGLADPDLTWLDYGYLALEAEVLSGWARGTHVDLAAVITSLVAMDQLRAWPVTGSFIEIGTTQQLQEAERRLLTAGAGQPEAMIE